MTFIYTDKVENLNSSVIYAIYYNEGSMELVVKLNSGVLAGYDDVEDNVALAFMKHESLGGSAGSYWNTMIKPNYTGFDTSWITQFVSEDEVDEDNEQEVAEVNRVVNALPGSASLEEALRKLREQLSNEPVDMIGDFERKQIEELNAKDNATVSEFVVFFRYEALNGDIRLESITAYAANEAGALSVFETYAEAARLGDTQVTSVTRFFD